MEEWDAILRSAANEYQSGESSRKNIRRVIERVIVKNKKAKWKIIFVRFGTGIITQIFDPDHHTLNMNCNRGKTRYEKNDINEFWKIVQQHRSQIA